MTHSSKPALYPILIVIVSLTVLLLGMVLIGWLVLPIQGNVINPLIIAMTITGMLLTMVSFAVYKSGCVAISSQFATTDAAYGCYDGWRDAFLLLVAIRSLIPVFTLPTNYDNGALLRWNYRYFLRLFCLSYNDPTPICPIECSQSSCAGRF